MTTTTTPTKQGLLLKALKDGRTVTHATALVDFKIPNLTAVIGDIRRAGVKVKCVRGVDGTGQRYSKFILG